MKIRSTWFRTFSAVALFFFAGRGVHGQGAATSGAQQPPPGDRFRFERMGPGPGLNADDVGFLGFEHGLGGKTVTGAPFSATFSSQSTQVLADGNRILHSTTGTVARDGQGRTRRDMTLPAIGSWAASGQVAPHVVFINDPVAGVHYVLHPKNKTADKITPPPNGWRGKNDPDSANGNDGGRWTEHQKEVVTASLGSQTVNGLLAEGTRYTRTIPAGEFGNEKPIVIVTEKWYSPDLQIVVMTKRSNPFRGDSISQLTNIQRQEPTPTMFQVPADFAISEGGSGHGGRIRHEQQPE